jgi:DNA-binding PadR family transcriptional regulator
MSVIRHTIPTEKEIFGDRKFSEIEVGLLQMQVLWILNHKPSHGYELMKILNEIKKTKITQGTLYPALGSLEKRSLIKSRKDERKVVYDITPEGRKVMSETCTDFSKTFFGIFQNYVCEKCVKQDTIKIGDKS